MSPKVSIIVPVYNTERYLRVCVDCILAQSYVDFELLLIDDGSTDDSCQICDKYAELDHRVRVFHKENGGVSSARNYGLEKSIGEWVTFVDSDDTIHEDYLKQMVESLQPDIDIIITGVHNKKEVTPDEYVKEILMRKLPPQIWGKLYRKRVIKDSLILPRELYWGEDLVSNILIGLNSNGRIILKDVHLYNYAINETSISKNREPSVEYEEFFLSFLQSKIEQKAPFEYTDALNYTKLYILEDLIVCKQKVGYNKLWIKELVAWAHTMPLTFRQKVVLYISNNIICRYVLALDRKLFKCH